MLKLNQIWNNILLEAEAKVQTLVYDLYINTLQPVGLYHDRLILLAETRAVKNIVDNNYKDILRSCTNVVFPSIVDIEIITEKDLPNVGNVEKEVDIPVSANYISVVEEKTNFISQYTFENFVVGKSNEYAEAVARAVADNPGTKYNPVFLWGGVGLGKTHLMHAIGNRLQRNYPEKKIMYVTCDQFMNEFIESLHDTSNPNAKKVFRDKYRKLDVLMMDDVQFLANKEGTQEEIFHTFNELYLSDKQIILSSDRPPKEIKIEERPDADAFVLCGSSFMKGLSYTACRIISGSMCRNKGGRYPAQLIVDLSFKSYEKKFHGKNSWLNRNEAEVKKYNDDPMCGFVCSANFYRSFMNGISVLYKKENYSRIDVTKPLLIISGSEDPVGEYSKGVNKLEKFYVKTVGMQSVTKHLYENARHEILKELCKDRVFSDILQWLDSCVNK